MCAALRLCSTPAGQVCQIEETHSLTLGAPIGLRSHQSPERKRVGFFDLFTPSQRVGFFFELRDFAETLGCFTCFL